MSKSLDDLKAAFAGESQANRRYLAFAQKAESEGYLQAAKLFRAAAEAETVHALNHFRAAGEIKSTAENLQTAVKGENYEATTMYPEFVGDAEKDQDKKALLSFTYALEAEKMHEALYTKMLAKLSKDTPPVDYYVCPVCGATYEGSAPDRCPVCSTPGARIKKVS
jgi:rubrerythrin